MDLVGLLSILSEQNKHAFENVFIEIDGRTCEIKTVYVNDEGKLCIAADVDLEYFV